MCRDLRLTGVILCGGLGTRIRAQVSDRPKALIKINDVPFIYYLLSFLEQAGLNKVVLCTGYRAMQIKATVGKRYGHMTIEYSEEHSQMGTGGALRNAGNYIDTNYVLVLNGDSYIEYDLKNYVRWHVGVDTTMSMIVKKVPDISRFGLVRMKQSGEVEKFVEKDNSVRCKSGYINTGVYLMNQATIERIPENCKVSLEKDIFPKLIGDKIFGYKVSGRFLDIGTPESMALADEFFSTIGHVMS